MRRARAVGKRVLRQAFEAAQRVGVDVLPRHYYSEIPDIRRMRQERGWRVPHTMIGVSGASLDEQLAFVRDCCPQEALSPLEGATSFWDQACREHRAVGYGPIDGLMLYGFIATHRPGRVIQIGAGVATSIILRAASDAGYRPEVTCVDPFPTDALRARAAADEIQLIARPAQELDRNVLLELKSGDFLFVDSTHTVKPGSEVNELILEVLPRLAVGAFAHFHDVLFPYDYSPTLLDGDLFFWTETVLLHSFLCFNSAWQLRASMSMLHHGRATELKTLFPSYRPAQFDDGIIRFSADGPQFPSAAYIQRVG